MGLDNSIYLHTHKKINLDLLPQWTNIKEILDKKTNEYVYELCYFRKSWGFRDLMYSVVRDYFKTEDINIEGGEYDLPANEKVIDEIQDVLYHFLKYPDDWDDRTQVFFMENSMIHIAQAILNMSWAREYAQEDIGCWLSFSDSF